MTKPYYRKLWEESHGEIPKDENGRSYDIHHINGNHSDDRLENLKCVSLKDHYAIHESQGDIMACCAIRRRMELPVNFTDEQKTILSEEARLAACKRVEKGTHNFLGGEIQKAHQARRKQEGSHNFVNSNPNFVTLPNGARDTLITCVDKNGRKVRIPGSIYKAQVGRDEDKDYVFHRSAAAGKRYIS